MKNKIARTLMIVATAAFMGSCSVTVPVSATSNSTGSKVGTASGSCYLGFLCFGVDASIRSAVKNGGISKVSSVDFKTTSILGLITTYETIVTGD